MKYYTFYRESNNFNDILNDSNLRANITMQILFKNRLIIGLKYNVAESVLGYIVLKYGDEIINLVEKDYTPKPNIDYKPLKN